MWNSKKNWGRNIWTCASTYWNWKFTVLRAVHKYKDSREQFERRTHKRLIDIKNPSKETVDALSHLDLPSGVQINIKL